MESARSGRFLTYERISHYFYEIFLLFFGQTPLHDAACNGYMDVMQLLLDRGAIPSIKNDVGHSALDTLRQWRANTVLNREKEEVYKNICARLQSQIRTTPADVSISPPGNSCLNRNRKTDKSPPSTSVNNPVARSPGFKKRNLIQDDSDDDIVLSPRRNQAAFPSDESSNGSSDESSRKKKGVSGVKEYRTAISALRHRRTSEADDLPEVEVKRAPKSALLDSNEVDIDEWLDDDLGVNKGKKRKLSDPLSSVTIAKKPTYESIKDSIENINRIEPLIDNNRKSIYTYYV